jgi:hypothetical protein
MFKYTRVQLNRSETTTMTIDLPPWEVPVMAAVNGEDRVVVIGETPVNRALPEPGVEYDRLAAKYKQNTENGQDYVATVYGVGQRGVEALAREINKAAESASAPPVQGAEYDSNDDPLRGLFDTAPPAASVGAVEIAE